MAPDSAGIFDYCPEQSQGHRNAPPTYSMPRRAPERREFGMTDTPDPGRSRSGCDQGNTQEIVGQCSRPPPKMPAELAKCSPLASTRGRDNDQAAQPTSPGSEGLGLGEPPIPRRYRRQRALNMEVRVVDAGALAPNPRNASGRASAADRRNKMLRQLARGLAAAKRNPGAPKSGSD